MGYIVDYATDVAPDVPVIVDAVSLKDAQAMAKKLSKQHGAAYVISYAYQTATVPGLGPVMVHTGQQVYYSGDYSHTDGDFS